MRMEHARWKWFLLFFSQKNLRAEILMWIVAHATNVVALLMIISTGAQWIAHCILTRRHDRSRGARRRWATHWIGWHSTGCLFGRIHIGLLLGFANILLVANAFVAKPIANLRHLQRNKKSKKRWMIFNFCDGKKLLLKQISIRK